MRALGLILVFTAAALWTVLLIGNTFDLHSFTVDDKVSCIWIAVLGLVFMVGDLGRRKQ